MAAIIWQFVLVYSTHSVINKTTKMSHKLSTQMTVRLTGALSIRSVILKFILGFVANERKSFCSLWSRKIIFSIWYHHAQWNQAINFNSGKLTSIWNSLKNHKKIDCCSVACYITRHRIDVKYNQNTQFIEIQKETNWFFFDFISLVEKCSRISNICSSMQRSFVCSSRYTGR